MTEPLVQPEGVNAGSAQSTSEGSGPATGGDVQGGGRPQDAPGPWDDQDEDGEELAGAPAESSEAAESGQDDGSIE